MNYLIYNKAANIEFYTQLILGINLNIEIKRMENYKMMCPVMLNLFQHLYNNPFVLLYKQYLIILFAKISPNNKRDAETSSA